MRGFPAESPGFGARCRAIRERRGLTLDAVARDSGLSKTYVWEIERGESSPSADTLMRLADTYGFTMDELWRGLGRAERLA